MALLPLAWRKLSRSFRGNRLSSKRAQSLTIESLEDRRMLAPGGCWRSTCGTKENSSSSDGSYSSSFGTPAGGMGYSSSSARSGQGSGEGGGILLNGPVFSHQLVFDPNWEINDELKYRSVLTRNGSPLFTTSIRTLAKTGLSEDTPFLVTDIAQNNLVGSGAFDYKFQVLVDPANNIWQNTDAVGDISFQDTDDSVYGSGWWLEDQDWLVEESDNDVIWLGYNITARFEHGLTAYTTPLGMRGDLRKVTSGGTPYFEFESSYNEFYRFDLAEVTEGSPAGRYLISSITDANGNVNQFEYEDKDGDFVKDDLVSKTDPFGRTVTLAYNSNGLMQSMTDYLGQVTNFEYSGRNLAKVKRPMVNNELGQSVRPELQFQYSTQGLLSKEIQENGRTRVLEFSSLDYRLKSINEYADVNATQFLSGYQYDAQYARALGTTATGTAPLAIPTIFLHSAEIDSRGNAIHRTLNEFSQIESEYVNPVYDSTTGLVVDCTSFVERDFDAYARLESESRFVQVGNQNGCGGNNSTKAVTKYDYSGSYGANLASIEESDTSFNNVIQTTFTNHNDSGMPTRIVDQLGRTQILEYNGAGGQGPEVDYRRFVIGIEDSPSDIQDDIVYTYVYTDGTSGTSTVLPKGLLWRETDPLGRATQYEYYETLLPANDPNYLVERVRFGLVKKITYADSSHIDFNYSYNASTGTTTILQTDELGRLTKSAYDALNRLVRVEEPDPDLVPGGTNGSDPIPVTEYRHDMAGNLRFVIDAYSVITEHQYDGANRRIKTIAADPDGAGNPALSSPVFEYRFDANGNQIAEIDPLLRMTTFQFDAANRPIATVQPDVDGVVPRPWTNPVNRYDVNGDGRVSNADVEAIAALDLKRADVLLGSSQSLPSIGKSEIPSAQGLFGVYYVDVNGDNVLSQADIDAINHPQTGYLAGPTNRPAGPDTPDYANDAGKPVVKFAYDPSGNLRFETNAEGKATEHRYDVRSRKVMTIQPLVTNGVTGSTANPMIEYGYDRASQMVWMKDPNGRETEYRHDEMGRRTSVIGADVDGVKPIWQNAAVASDVNWDGTIDWKDQASGLAMDVNQDGRIDTNDVNLLTTIHDARETFLAGGSHNSYEHYFQFTSLPLPADQEFLLDVDGIEMGASLERPVDVNGDGHLTSDDIAIVSNFLTTGEVDESLLLARATSQFIYDKASNLTFIVDAMRSVTQYQYSSRDRVTFVVEEKPLGARSVPGAFVDLSSPSLIAAARSTRPITEYGYSLVGEVTQIVDPLSRVSSFDYDSLDRMKKATLPDPDPNIAADQPVFEWTYDLLGNLKSLKNAESQITTLDYDFLYRRLRVTAPSTDNGSGTYQTPITNYKYDAASQITIIVDPLSREWQTVFDDAGRQKTEYKPNPVSGLASGNRPYVTHSFDLVGNILSESNALGHTRNFMVDALNRQFLINDERGYDTDIAFDLSGNTVKVTDPNLNETVSTIDGLNRVSHETNELGDTRTFLHDLRGNLVEKTDRRGLVTQYNLDNLYRPLSEEWLSSSGISERTISFAFDFAGNMTQASDPGFTYAYIPDSLDRVKQVSNTFVGMSGTVTLGFGYNRMNQNTSTAATVGSTNDYLTSRQYDELQRLKSISQGNQGTSTNVSGKYVEFKHDLANQLKSVTRRAGATAADDVVSQSVYRFDNAGRLEDLEHRRKTQTTDPLAKYTFVWDSVNRIDSIDSLQDGFVDYGYDDAGQLTSAAYQAYGPFQMNEGYYYDDNGNRVAAEFVDGNPIEVSGYWEMEDGTGSTTVTDSSGNALTMSFTGSPAWITSGLAPVPDNSYSLSFPNKGDYLTLASASTLQAGYGDFSASTWLKSSSSLTQDIPIMGFGTPNGIGGKGFEFVYRAGVSGKPLVLRINDGITGAQTISYSTNGSLSDDNWHHVGFTNDRDGQLVLYIDGRAVRSAASSQTGNINPTGSFMVARAPGISMSSGALARWMDEARFYHNALSPAEMQNQYLGTDNGSSVTYTIGANNQLLADEDFSYEYDQEGNRSERARISGMDTDFYTWDHRNRLTQIERMGPRELFWLSFESDDGSKIVDTLGNAVDGTTVNNAHVDTALPHGGDNDAQSLHLDGNGDYGDLGIQDVFKPTQHGMTLMAWMYPEAAGPMNLVAFGSPSATEPGYSLTYERTTGGANKFVFKFSDGVGTTFDTFTYTSTGATLLNAWTHIAVIIDDVTNGMTLYVDGADVQTWTPTESTTWGNVLQPFLVGVSSVATGDYFKGQLDDIRVVPYAVQEAAIAYAESHPEPQLVSILQVNYFYDHQNRLISWDRDKDGPDGPGASIQEFFVHDGPGQGTTSATINPDNLEEVGQVVLRLNGSGQVTHRYLWGSNVDELLADENVTSQTAAGETRWTLGDQLGTVRDVVKYSGSNVQEIAHRTYDSFGNITSEENAQAVDILFGYTGRAWDEVSELQNNLNRWYDPGAGLWISEDPIGFGGGDANLVRYLKNKVNVFTDPTGLYEFVRAGVQAFLEFFDADGAELDRKIRQARVNRETRDDGDPSNFRDAQMHCRDTAVSDMQTLVSIENAATFGPIGPPIPVGLPPGLTTTQQVITHVIIEVTGVSGPVENKPKK
jgi:RHS repeat-associated protein